MIRDLFAVDPASVDTMADPELLETIRRETQARINAQSREREALEDEYGRVWSTDELAEEFEVIRYLAPIVLVRHRYNGAAGSLFFQHHPRFYWGFEPEEAA